MYVVFGHVRQIVIDHVRELFDIESARGEIGGNQHAHLARLEIRQRLGARALTLVTVNCRRRYAGTPQLMREAIRAMLGARKYQHLFPVAGFHQMREQCAFAILAHRMHALRHQLGLCIAPRHLHHHRVGQQAIGQRANVVGEGRREQQILPLLGQQRQNALHVVNETHIKHAVGFIQHQNFHLRQIHRLLVGVIEQAARCRHQYVDARFQRIDLRPDADAAEYHRRTQRQILAVGMHTLFDLRGEFPRGRHNQRAHGIGARLGRIFHQALQQRQRKAGGFTGAGLRAREYIAAFKYYGYRLYLHRRGLRIAMIGHRAR